MIGDLLGERNAYVLGLSVIGLSIFGHGMLTERLTPHDTVPLPHNHKHRLQSRD